MLGTYTLFYHSILYTVIISALVFLIFLVMNRGRKHYRSNGIILSSIFMLIYIFFRFLTDIAYDIDQVRIFSFIEALCILGIFMVQLSFYSQKNYILINVSVFLILLSRFRFFMVFNFGKILLTDEFRYILIYFVVLLTVLVIHDTRKVLKQHNKAPDFKSQILENKRYKLIETFIINLSFLFVLLCCLPVIVSGHLLMITELSVVFYFTMVFVTFLFFMPSIKIPLGYRQIISNMMDTVLILDEKNNILYINDTPILKYFSFGTSVDFNRFSTYINGSFLSEQYLRDGQKQIIFESDEEIMVMNVFRKVLLRQNRIVGFMINISDCSHLDFMIREKEKQKNDLDQLKVELTKYEKTSKNLLAEKQRNRLLVEVQNQLGHHMAELANHISTIIHIVDDESIIPTVKQPIVQSDIETGIQIAKGNLARIRDTVVKYKSSYNEKGSEGNDKGTFSG